MAQKNLKHSTVLFQDQVESFSWRKGMTHFLTLWRKFFDSVTQIISLVTLGSNDDEFSVPERYQGVSISGDEADGLDGQVQRQGMKLLQGEEVTQHEVSIFVATHEEGVIDGERADAVHHGIRGQPTPVEAVDVDGVDVSAVTWEHDLSLGGDCQVGDGEVVSRVWRDQGPQVDALLNSEDVDCSIFRSGNGEVEVYVEGDAGNRFVVPTQHLQRGPKIRVSFRTLGLYNIISPMHIRGSM